METVEMNRRHFEELNFIISIATGVYGSCMEANQRKSWCCTFVRSNICEWNGWRRNFAKINRNAHHKLDFLACGCSVRFFRELSN
ncbi:hypothetical protein FRX31_014194 [Thalictrum thalictroides]|uniref:Uncharacterized protein n=1 Tax=Thalictrum thalictroides TaxID=46969 RepID=A0A7J6WJD1_THATH|nr:hypothetical protein FRX31_014194 [Thalictrum thalictroides]